MKPLLIFLIGSAILSSCCDEGQYNPSGLDPSKMDETELYHNYGLEAPVEFYEDLLTAMDSSGFGRETYCSEIKSENPLSCIISVAIRVDSLNISNAMISRSDYSNKVNNEIERLLNTMTWGFDLENRKSGDREFRLDMSRLYELK